MRNSAVCAPPTRRRQSGDVGRVAADRFPLLIEKDGTKDMATRGVQSVSAAFVNFARVWRNHHAITCLAEAYFLLVADKEDIL